MSFLSPAFLVALPLLGVPLLIHLLSKRQQKKISWGAMRFLMQAATRKRRLWRLTDLLLLLLRTAAFLFFIAALARPLVPVTWLGGSLPREVILVLDRSMSMGRKTAEGTVFESALQQADQLLAALTPSDTIRVMTANDAPEWLMPEARPATAATVRRIRAQVAQLKPTLGAANLVACIREATDLEAPKGKSARIIAVVSDRQRFGWRMEEKPLWAAAQARIKQAPIDTTVSLQLVGEEKPAANLSVNGIDTARPFGAAGQSLTFTASIQNHNTSASAATLLAWRVNGEPAGVVTVPELGPGAVTSLTLNHSFPAAGTFDVSCRLEGNDDLPADDESHLIATIVDQVPVLLVDDAPSHESLENDAPFVLAALGARNGDEAKSAWHSVFNPTVVTGAQVGSTNLAPFHCVIIANAGALPASTVDKLEAYVQQGGGVWIAAGAQTESRAFNEQFHRGGAGLAPLKISGAVGDPNDHDKFFPVRAASDSHPATALLADFQKLDLDRARIYRRHQFDPLSGKDVSVLLQTTAAEPVVVERKFGRGRVIVQAVPLGVSWSTLPLCQAYVAMLHEWLWYLSEPNLPRRNLAVGESIIEEAGRDTGATLTAPDGALVALEPDASGSDSGMNTGRPLFRHVASLPGEYQLATKNGGVARFHVQRNARESDLAAFNEQDQQFLASVAEFHVGGGLNSLSKAAVEAPRRALEGWLLVALAAILLGELTLAGWATQRRNLRVKPVSMTA